MLIARATLDDSRDIWKWRNDPLTRAMSLTSDEVSFESHSVWFEKALKNPDCFLFVGYPDSEVGKKIGMCRFEIERQSNSATVSLNLNPEFRGKGLSHILLSDAITEFRKHLDILIIATIRNDNSASIKCFVKCGFVRESSDREFGYYSLKQ